MVLGQLAIHMRKKENKAGFKNRFQIDKTCEGQLQPSVRQHRKISSCPQPLREDFSNKKTRNHKENYLIFTSVPQNTVETKEKEKKKEKTPVVIVGKG